MLYLVTGLDSGFVVVPIIFAYITTINPIDAGLTGFVVFEFFHIETHSSSFAGGTMNLQDTSATVYSPVLNDWTICCVQITRRHEKDGK